MDPITVATKRFLQELERHWKRHPGGVARLVARVSDRVHLIKALRLAEYEPSNRRPLFVFEAGFEAAEIYFAGLCQQVTSDYELVRKGAAEEGVTLAPLDAPTRSPALTPEAHAMAVLAAAGERLGTHLDGAFVALVPKATADTEAWRRSMERLSRTTRLPSLRMAVLDPEDGPLVGVLGSEGARFSFDTDELFDFVEQQTNRTSAGPPVPPGPSVASGQRAGVGQAPGREAVKPETAAALQALFLKGARGAAKNDFGAAVAAYRSARDLCHDQGLAQEEAMAAFALGGAHLAAGNRPMAQVTYGQAALLAAQEKLWLMSCQAKLGEAGVGWMEQDFGRAARAYAEAASLAKRGEMVPLYIEARRMEGLCHQHRGAEPEAIVAWRKAVEEGTVAEEPARRASTFREVVTALADLLEERGLRPQAIHLRSLLDES
ncbi:hypothetical protein [Chondromyces apiculatus]|uniref:Uncharacterized protein n=1 Tax=Chondromyces apiculatus DSM 436 TaxID=1192034 RepID=A0A017T0Z3_9BACT|nr:hypothetical protein [Chondromyces apiculatus]EYF02226.1 Hypothetical protein CAP_7298 [Chondromyces apiculatus DSM 436]